MRRKWMNWSLGVIVFVFGGDLARADGWSDKLFDTVNHDFGYVARGYFTKTFTITNNQKKPVHIQSVEPSCRVCTAAKPEKDLLQPGESTALDVRIDTFSYTEKTSVSVAVTFDRPSYSLTRLNLRWKIRSDIVFNPPDLRFGTVKRGTEGAKTMKIEYAGDPNWKIASAECTNSALEVELTESHREKSGRGGTGTVGYVMTVKLRPDAPAGPIRDRIVLGINDAYSKSMDVALQANVQSDVNLSPATLSFGKVPSGSSPAMQAIVRGVKPFKIVSINGEEGAFEIEKPDDTKPLHKLTVKLKPGRDPGEVAQDFEIVTDMEGEAPLKLAVSATLTATPRPANGSNE